MRKLGVIGGLSWAATGLYYRHLNEGVQKRTSAVCSAPLVIESLNSCDLRALKEPEEWARAERTLADAARRLEAAGATAILIAANSMHKVHDGVAGAVEVPILHIAEATGAAMAAAGVKRAAIIGTRNVMTESWFSARVARHGVTLVAPENGRVEEIDRIIYDELMAGIAKRDSERTMKTFLTDLAKTEIDAIVLASTELQMIVDPDANVLPIFDTTRIHARAGVDWILGEGEGAA